MSTFNDTASVTTSEMNSFCGNSMVDMAQEILRLREEIRLMKAGKPSQLIPPCWIKKETEAVEQCLDEFRVAFNEAKQCILENRGNEDIIDNYEEMKNAARLTEKVKEVWMSAARDVKKHLGGITQKLNGFCGSNNVGQQETVKKVEERLWMNVDLSEIPADELPIINFMGVVPVIDAETIKICKGLVGAWKLDDTNRTCPDNKRVPTTLVISYHNCGFFGWGRRHWEPFYFRPDGKRYEFKSAHFWDRECTINDDKIFCRNISPDGKILEHSFLCVSENRIEYTFRNSEYGSNDGTYSYIADM